MLVGGKGWWIASFGKGDGACVADDALRVTRQLPKVGVPIDDGIEMAFGAVIFVVDVAMCE